MVDSKKSEAEFYGKRSALLAVGCTVGIVFTWPPGWLVLGACAGVGSGMAVSSYQQYQDDSQPEFSKGRMVFDGFTGGVCSLVSMALAKKTLEKEGILSKKGIGIVLATNVVIPAAVVGVKNEFFYHRHTRQERKVEKQEAENQRDKQVVQQFEEVGYFDATEFIFTNSYIDSKDQEYVIFMSKIGSKQVSCYAKGLATEHDTGVTHDEKLASWKKAREIGVGPLFKENKGNPMVDPQDLEQSQEDQHWIVVEAGITLLKILSQGQQSLAQLRSFRDQIREISKKLKSHKLAHQDIKPANMIVIGSTIFLIDNDHLRGFEEPRTVSAGNAVASNGQKFAASSNGITLKDMKCNENTDKKGFMLLKHVSLKDCELDKR